MNASHNVAVIQQVNHCGRAVPVRDCRLLKMINVIPRTSIKPSTAVDVDCGITTVAILNQPDSPSVMVVDVTADSSRKLFCRNIATPLLIFLSRPFALSIAALTAFGVAASVSDVLSVALL